MNFRLLLLTISLKFALSVDYPFLTITDKYCISNSPYAVAVLDPIERSYKKSPPFYIPKLDSSLSLGISCNFNDNEGCTTSFANLPWTIQTSAEGGIDEVILDKRWEDFGIVLTEDVTDSFKFTPVLSISNSSDFVIPFSIRIDKEAQIFLCEAQYPPSSNCYWLLIAGWSGTKTAFRKCSVNDPVGIQKKRGDKFPQKKCAKERGSVIQYSKSKPNPLSSKIWKHFKLKKTGNTINVFDEKDDLQFYYEDQDSFLFNPKYMLIHSRTDAGLWKIHNYKYIFTRESVSVNIGPPFNPRRDINYCISVFVLMCKECSLKFYIRGEENTVVYTSEIFTTQDEKWKQIKFTFKVDRSMIRASLYTDQLSNNAKDQFWAIDDIRECHESEHKVYGTFKSQIRCQEMNYYPQIPPAPENKVLLVESNLPIEKINHNCPQSSFGEHCIPCKWINTKGEKWCPGFKYCEFYSSEVKRCSCSSGYYGPFGQDSFDCSETCGAGTFGHNCEKTCEMCQDGCEPIGGYCRTPTCYDNFDGPKCDIPFNSQLEFPPTPVQIGIDYCVVRVTNFSTVGKEAPRFYKIQVKKSLEQWIDVEQAQNFNVAVDIRIPNLEADTEYFVRGILYSDENNINYQGVVERPFRTDCNFITASDIHIDRTNNSVSVSFKRGEKNCRFHNYDVVIENSRFYLNNTNQINIFKTDLTPAMTYNLIIRYATKKYSLNVEFTTLDGIPDPVTDIEQELPLSPTSLHITWKEPAKKNSMLLNYTVEYKLLRYKACSKNFEGSAKTVEVYGGKTKVMIPNVEIYAYFQVEVFPVSTAGTGISRIAKIVETSDTTEQISSEETPGTEISTGVNIATFTFKIPSCEKVKGPIFVHASYICLAPWCDNLEVTPDPKDCHKDKDFYRINGLYAFSNYTVNLNFCRESTQCKEGYFKKQFNFKTQVTVPTPVKDLTATSKGPQEIVLRWSPPNPPNGILEKYVVVYQYKLQRNQMVSFDQDILPTSCKLWPDYHCAKITANIHPSLTYTLWMVAKNIGTIFSNDGNVIVEQTIESVSDKPYNLKTNWTKDDVLWLFWTHPNKTNGLLTNFTINIQEKYRSTNPLQQIYILPSEDDYRLNYNIKIENLTLPNILDISVVPYNSAGKGKPATIMDCSPPPMPTDFTVDVSTENRSISVHITSPETPNFMQKGFEKLIYVLISDEPTAKNNEVELTEFEHSLSTGTTFTLKSFTLVKTLKVSNTQIHLKIQNTTQDESENGIELIPGVKYNISFIVVNAFDKKVRLRRKSILQAIQENGETEPRTAGEGEEGGGGAYALILLLFLIPILGYMFIWYRKNLKPQSVSLENILDDSKSNTMPPISSQPDIALISVPNETISKEEKIINVVKPHNFKPKASVRNRDQTPTHSELVKITDFELYVKSSIENGELKRQHELFPRGHTQKAAYGSRKENKSKNRYNNIVAYDHNRVKLQKVEGIDSSDYINANYIDGYKTPKAYIATQGPKTNTVYDFWRMVWQENVKHIIMLANVYEGGKKKTEKYWPDINEELVFKEIKIHYVSSEIHANFEYRSFIVTVDQSQRKIEQLHYTTWPDHGVPLYSQNLVPFLQKILKIPNNSRSPVIVHCSAGVGRTGTIILCDITLRMAASEGYVDLLASLDHLRSQRANMVDNIEQYKLAHLVVLECLSGLQTSIPCNQEMEDVIENLISSNSIKSQIRYIRDTEWQDEAMKTISNTGEEMPIYQEKNRFPDIVPENHCRVYVSHYPPSDKTSPYINAIRVDGFCNPGKFIVTQQPMPNTLGDFWRLVSERNVTVVISLNNIDTSDETVCQFWPLDDTEIRPVDYLAVQKKSTRTQDAYTLTTLHVIKDEDQSKKSVIRFINYNGWKHNEKVPINIDNFLMFLEESNAVSRRSDPVIITCYDGATACGLYIAMSFLIEKMKLEHECDVCQAIRSIRHNRRQFVDSEDQIEFLYRASARFIRSFQPYSNFDNNTHQRT